jgi:hypothetical protein
MDWIGVDVGGTFTDVVLYDSAARELRVLKTPSTTHDQSEGIVAGLDRLGIDQRRIVRFGHGSTVATNTALERNGARTAVVVTSGHRDILVVGPCPPCPAARTRVRPIRWLHAGAGPSKHPRRIEAQHHVLPAVVLVVGELVGLALDQGAHGRVGRIAEDR